MAITHIALARVTRKGVAALAYAHPDLQKTSKSLYNPKVIHSGFKVGDQIELRIKVMNSGRRQLVHASPAKYENLDKFIERNLSALKTTSAIVGKTGSGTYATDFNGSDDKDYRLPPLRGLFGTQASAPTAPAPLPTTPRVSPFSSYGDLLIHKTVQTALSAVEALLKEVGAVNTLLVGQSGNGKTSLAAEFAKQHGMDFVKVNCSTVRDPEEWFGYREAENGSTVFVPTAFTESVERGNAVILLDELNRLEPYLHNSLMPLLDETRSTTVHGHNIEVGPNVVFFSTINIGSGFVGTFMLDTALKNRMDLTVIMPSLDRESEISLITKRVGLDKTKAAKVVDAIRKVREVVAQHQVDVDVSIRSLLKVARVMKSELFSIKETVTLVIFNNAETPEQTKLLVDSVTEI